MSTAAPAVEPPFLSWLEPPVLGLPGSLGMMACPGRGGDLEADLDRLAALGVVRVVSLLDDEELRAVGAAQLPEALAARGLGWWRLGIPDFGVPEPAPAAALLAELRRALGRGERLVLHCRAGLGRTGMIAASLLVTLGRAPEEAVALVRAARDPRCVETEAQRDFIGQVSGIND